MYLPKQKKVHLNSLLNLKTVYVSYLASYYLIFISNARHAPGKKFLCQQLLSSLHLKIGAYLLKSGLFPLESD